MKGGIGEALKIKTARRPAMMQAKELALYGARPKCS